MTDSAFATGIFLVLAVILDFFFPGSIRLRADSFFKRDVDDFYKAYGAGRMFRFTIAAALGLAGFAASFFDFGATVNATILSVAGGIYIALLLYFMWRAEVRGT